MSVYESISVIVAIFSIIISSISLYLAGSASNLNKNMFKRQGIIDLHMAWQGVNEIDNKNIVTPDVVKAVNALNLTASLWNHDVIEKIILYQSYWVPYNTLYNQINQMNDVLPGLKKTGNDYLTSEIKRAYEGMKEFDLNKVDQTKI